MMFGNKEKIIKTVKIEGMSCMHCVKKVEEALKRIKGVKEVTVNLDAKRALIIAKQEIEETQIKNIIEEIGYEVVEIE